MLEIPKKVDQSLQSSINKSIIFNFVREQGAVSRAEIAKKLNISASAVSRVADVLIKDDFIVETNKVKTAVGKRPIMLQVNGEKGTVLGIDLSQDRVQLALCNFIGRVLDKKSGFRIRGDRNEAEKLTEEVADFIVNKEHPLAVSVGIPADIDRSTGMIISASLYDDWKNINFKSELSKLFDRPIIVEKDVTLSVLAEKNDGCAKDKSDVVFVEISNGVSAGIIIGDRLLRGATDSAGQISFCVTEEIQTKANWENKGYLDEHASIQSINSRVLKGIEQGRSSCIKKMIQNDPERIETALICTAAHQGDELAGESIAEAVHLLSTAIVNLIVILNPEILILGGNIAKLPHVEELFLNPIKEFVSKMTPAKLPDFRISSLGENVVLIGAAQMAINSIISGVFPYKIGQE